VAVGRRYCCCPTRKKVVRRPGEKGTLCK
jgi:hypothetical protein